MEEEEQYVTLAEIKALLEREEKERKDLSMEQKYALTHAQTFARITTDQSTALVAELMKVEMMTPGNAYKLADLLPTHPEDVRAVFAKERFSLSKEDVDLVVQIVSKYL
ncbi:MAG TPA: RNA polymerase Rpb4 family protein [Thermoplasmata archaeon]|nr:RNA polymerase Rpb4 family protein [Thermoplasmata archaeon]